jgi:TolB protein
MLILACAMCLFTSFASTDSGAPTAHPPAAVEAPRVVLAPTDPGLVRPGEERHLRNIRQLTFGHSADFAGLPHPANYAEAYWSPDGKQLVLQSTRNEHECDQLFTLDLITGALELKSTGAGRVTCGFFFSPFGGLIYSSTHENGGPECPPRPDMSRGYVWPIYPTYDIYFSDGSPSGTLRNITQSPGYDAEGTVDWNTGWLYFTSTRDGDIDIYRQRTEGPNMLRGEVQRLTDSFGYDGGPFISYDGQTVVFRRQVFADDAERADYSALLAENMVRPSKMELWAMHSDGSAQRQLTNLGGANFAPFLHPDNQTVIFCSNYEDPKGRTFELYTIPLAGGDVTRITHGGEFDGFPMFSPDGKYLVWCSNRNSARSRETNIFVAEWVP